MTTPTQTQFQTGLRGAIGCDFARASNQLFLVEFDGGRLSSLRLVQDKPLTHRSASATISPRMCASESTESPRLLHRADRRPVRVAFASANRRAATVVTTPLIGNASSKRVDSQKAT